MKRLLAFMFSVLWAASASYGARVHVERMSDGGSASGPVSREPSSFGGSVRPVGASRESGGTWGQRASGGAGHGRTRIVLSQPGVVRSLDRQRRVEVVPNHRYWHSVNGFHYSHFYNRGVHWYGFYDGPHHYWSRYYGNHWWWFDPDYSRWAFWASGYWWWPAPTGILYVYVNNDYYPYDSGVVSVPPPGTVPAPRDLPPQNETPPAASAEDQTWKSPDGKRMVQTVGSEDEAYLYDISSGKTTFLKFLDRNVSNVRFKGGTDGKPLQLLLDYDDGHFKLFSADGDPLE